MDKSLREIIRDMPLFLKVALTVCIIFKGLNSLYWLGLMFGRFIAELS